MLNLYLVYDSMESYVVIVRSLAVGAPDCPAPYAVAWAGHVKVAHHSEFCLKCSKNKIFSQNISKYTYV